MRKIYLASSWRNTYQPQVLECTMGNDAQEGP